MPPKKLSRPSTVQQPLPADLLAKRTKHHLDQLERSNYSEPTLLAHEDDGDDHRAAKGRGRHVISDKRQLAIQGNSPAARKKKSTMNVRTALLYRKSLAVLIDESNIAALPANVPTYLTAAAPPSTYPARKMCSVCGYWGSYSCRRCGMGYCDVACESVHAETRCERRVI